MMKRIIGAIIAMLGALVLLAVLVPVWRALDQRPEMAATRATMEALPPCDGNPLQILDGVQVIRYPLPPGPGPAAGAANLDGEGYVLDAWGHRLHWQRSGDVLSIISPGPDGLYGTSDDLRYDLHLPSPGQHSTTGSPAPGPP